MTPLPRVPARITTLRLRSTPPWSTVTPDDTSDLDDANDASAIVVSTNPKLAVFTRTPFVVRRTVAPECFDRVFTIATDR